MPCVTTIMPCGERAYRVANRAYHMWWGILGSRKCTLYVYMVPVHSSSSLSSSSHHVSQPQRSTNERTCDGVYSPSTGTSATRLSFLSLRDSGLALHPSLARGHFLARFCTAVFPLAGGGSITVSLVVSNGRSAPKASHLIGSSLP